MSVCLGPFSQNPVSVQFDLKTRDFLKENLFKVSKKPNYEKVVLEDKSSGVYYVFLLIVKGDLEIKIIELKYLILKRS